MRYACTSATEWGRPLRRRGHVSAGVGEELADHLPGSLDAHELEVVDQGERPPVALLDRLRHGRVSGLLHREDARPVVARVARLLRRQLDELRERHVVAGSPDRAEHPGVRVRGFLELRGVALRLAVEEELHDPAHLVILVDRVRGAGLTANYLRHDTHLFASARAASTPAERSVASLTAARPWSTALELESGCPKYVRASPTPQVVRQRAVCMVSALASAAART